MTNPTTPTDVLVNFVLDKSASMSPLRQSSIDGFNQFLDEQRAQPGECRMSLTLFNTSFDVRYVGKPVKQIRPIGMADYLPDGWTALLDAVGTTIKGAEEWVRNHSWTGKVIVAVLTDGEENSSHEWHINHPSIPGDEHDLLGLIQWKQNEGWEFVLLGAGGSQWLERTFGSVVAADRILQYDHNPMSHAQTYAGLSASVSQTRSSGTFDPASQMDQDA